MDNSGNKNRPDDDFNRGESINIDIKDDVDGNITTDEREYKSYTPEDWLLIILMFSLFIVISFQVWGRLLFRAGGLSWTDELGRMCLVGLVYMSMGVVTKYDLHFKIDKLPHLPKILYKVFDIVSILIMFVIMVILAVCGIQLMQVTANTITPSLGWTKAIFYAPLTIGSIFVIYHTVRKIINVIRRND